MKTADNWYSHIPKAICGHEDITVLWNQDVQILCNRPDIITRNMTDKIFLLMHVAIPSERNLMQKQVKNTLKHKNLSMKIQLIRIRNVSSHQ
jgi:hypothetical protein